MRRYPTLALKPQIHIKQDKLSSSPVINYSFWTRSFQVAIHAHYSIQENAMNFHNQIFPAEMHHFSAVKDVFDIIHERMNVIE